MEVLNKEIPTDTKIAWMSHTARGGVLTLQCVLKYLDFIPSRLIETLVPLSLEVLTNIF